MVEGWTPGIDWAYSWPDCGRRVEIRDADGTLREGECIIDDACPGPDGDWPIARVEVDGADVSMYDVHEWRWKEPRS